MSDPNQVVDCFYKYLNESISHVFRTFKPKKLKDNFPSNKWFDDECKILKHRLNESYRNNSSEACQNDLRKEYKRIIQKKKRTFYLREAETLNSLCKNKQTDFWKRWKKLKGHLYIYDHIKIETFTDYYRTSSFSNPEHTFDQNFMSDLTKAMLSYGKGEQHPKL